MRQKHYFCYLYSMWFFGRCQQEKEPYGGTEARGRRD